jgi:Cu/Ag efflux pump CusA
VFDYIIHAALKQRLIVLGVSLLLMIYGAITLRQMPVDVFPDLNKPTVTLMTEAGGMAPEEVEQLVTFPVESSMNGMPRRDARALGIGYRFVDRLCRVRVGLGYLPQPAAGRRTPQPGA